MDVHVRGRTDVNGEPDAILLVFEAPDGLSEAEALALMPLNVNIDFDGLRLNAENIIAPTDSNMNQLNCTEARSWLPSTCTQKAPLFAERQWSFQARANGWWRLSIYLNRLGSLEPQAVRKVEIDCQGGASFALSDEQLNALNQGSVRYKNAWLQVREDRATGRCEPRQGDGCFLTTAACDHIGLADDCWELRRFRDTWLRPRAEGEAEVQLYYDLAPKILERRLTAPGSARWLNGIYWGTILPCAALIAMGFNESAYARYKALIARESAKI